MNSPPVEVAALAAESHKWSKWWVGMWAMNVVILLSLIPFLNFGRWVTATLILFGIPEFIGTLKQDDAFPPLTHVIVKYLDRELAFPVIFFFYGSTAAYWFAFPNRAWALGAFAGLLGWLIAHFERRYERR